MISFLEENTNVVLGFIYQNEVIDMSVDVLLGIFSVLCIVVSGSCFTLLAMLINDDIDEAKNVVLTLLCIISAYIGYQCYLALGW